MRLVCFLCTFFVLLLATRPCCNDSECNFKTSPASKSTDNNAARDNDCKGCSPFFSCGTCVGFVVVANTDHSAIIMQERYVEHYIAYQPPYIDDVTLSIWQPPQLS